jgi:ketosteroid isomerase-like protein
MTAVEVVRAMFTAYREQDAARADQLLDDGFVFTSPQDEHIDKAAFMERCFPTVSRFVDQEFLTVEETGAGVLALYEYELESGERYRNAEMLTVRDGRIAEAHVFFGGQYSRHGRLQDRAHLLT